ncbi:galactosyltransferase-related protein [Streptomyces venezuelae]|uniref:galactosyltransferase-related protein n=1 Tax=Streptomyces venezuelae TaxID=54571 RepID=UPI0036582A4C
MPTPPEPPRPSADRLAERLTAYAVLAHDPAVPAIAADYWAKSEDHYRTVDAALAAFVSGTARAAYEKVLADPVHATHQHTLRAALTALLDAYPAKQGQLAEAVAEADRHIWIDYHLGADYTAQAPPLPPEASAAAGAAGTPGARPRTGAPDVQVVIPFRDRAGGTRTRNLLACLRALADQEGGPGHRVTVVETDSEPRTREALAGVVDRYVFARKDGLFNKAWAVNVGVVQATREAAPGSEYVCVLDADILVDRHFVARNTARLRDGGHGTHLPFRWSLSLDAPSTLRAIGLRNDEGAADVPASVLRGLLLREPPGGCVWLRADVFHAVGGFDERYEGWGGEDDDVVARLGAAAPLHRYEDALLHLDHPRPEMTREDGEPFNAHIEPGSWTGEHGYGVPERFTGS